MSAGWQRAVTEAVTDDAGTGFVSAAPQRVAFTCVVPKEHGPGTPVALFGHGYGSSRFDVLGFAWAFAEVGWAVCACDFPGHGPTVQAGGPCGPRATVTCQRVSSVS